MRTIRFTRAARKHRIGRAHARYVMATTTPIPTVTDSGDGAWLYVGTDDRDLELEIIAVDYPAEELLVVIHVMPTALRKEADHD